MNLDLILVIYYFSVVTFFLIFELWNYNLIIVLLIALPIISMKYFNLEDHGDIISSKCLEQIRIENTESNNVKFHCVTKKMMVKEYYITSDGIDEIIKEKNKAVFNLNH